MRAARPRRSGKMAFDIKIDYAVKQIQGFLANQGKTHGAQ